MDVLIKNMEMPLNCMDYCKFCEDDMTCKLTGEDISSYDGKFGREDFCPLVEVELQGYDNYWESEIWTEVKHGLAD